MKCHSVAALWSPSPPSHHVTAAAATPSALFTGAADGTVLHWPLAPPLPPPPPCAHPRSSARTAAAITSLCPLPSPVSLLASCTAGVLSLFSASAPLRCLRRRSLPPWAGVPSLVAPLPSSSSSSPRVAILCHASDDGGHRHVSALVVVDARTLAVLHTAFHGPLSVAPPRAIAVCGGDVVNVVLADAQGRTQVVPVAGGAAVEVDSPRRLSASSLSSVASVELADGGVEAVALSHDGKVVALVLKERCLLKCVAEGTVLGELSLVHTSLCKDDKAGEKGCITGGVFLNDGEYDARVSDDGNVVRSLVLWSSNGAAVVYRFAVGSTSFEFEAACEIPGDFFMQLQGERSAIKFCQSDGRLVRVESRPHKVAGSLLWEPIVSVWSMVLLEPSMAKNTDSPPLSKVLGEGGLREQAFRSECSHSQYNLDNGVGVSSHKLSEDTDGLEMYGRTVSSSMVLSEDSYTPYAVVYGFHNGDIEVIRFLNMSPAAAKFGGGGIYPHMSERGISKNAVTGSILGGTTSASSLLVPIFKDTNHHHPHANKKGHGISSVSSNHQNGSTVSVAVSAPATYDFKGKMQPPDEAHDFHRDNSGKAVSSHSVQKKRKCPIKCSCPYPGIASLRFDLTAIMSTQGMTNINSERPSRDHLCTEILKKLDSLEL
ncbi:hypothetical protein PR202_gb22964 [Eleusine coracana subsp. coracana]|uniref:Transducin/WD40 repeat-like superfamily protein n=1 Tax=Eleusine coracana subsp. coracana TaxID=191504 RepID=A0AAV5FIM9_ELECO|nr:hypothetical protein PR202_gb22964 [Eleusine coracana subsp. coracana]